METRRRKEEKGRTVGRDKKTYPASRMLQQEKRWPFSVKRKQLTRQSLRPLSLLIANRVALPRLSFIFNDRTVNGEPFQQFDKKKIVFSAKIFR